MTPELFHHDRRVNERRSMSSEVHDAIDERLAELTEERRQADRRHEDRRSAVRRPLNLSTVKALAAEVVRVGGREMEVVGVIGSAAYAEVIIVVRGCHRAPCQFVVGVQRATTPNDFRLKLEEQIQEHLSGR